MKLRNKKHTPSPPFRFVATLALFALCAQSLPVHADDSFSGEAGGVMPHTHQWASAADVANHWMMCQFEGCTVTKDLEPHSYVDNGAWRCDTTMEHFETCSVCDYYHPLDKVHSSDNTIHGPSDRVFHIEVCEWCGGWLNELPCKDAQGHYLGCHGEWLNEDGKVYAGVCATCNAQRRQGHSIVSIQKWLSEGEAGVIVLDSDTSLHTDVECACMACGQVSVVARMDQERSAFSDVFSYADFKMETTDGWAFRFTPVQGTHYSGSCSGRGHANYMVDDGSSSVYRDENHLEARANINHKSNLPDYPDYSSQVTELHFVTSKHYPCEDGTLGIWTGPGGSQQSPVTHITGYGKTEWEKPKYTSDIEIVDEVKTNGWTTQATIQFTANDKYSNTLYYGSSCNIGGRGTETGGLYSEGNFKRGHDFDVSYMPAVEADEDGQWVEFWIRDGAYNYGTQEVFLQKWDHKPPVPLTTEDDFNKEWSNSKGGIVTCADFGIGEVTFAFNDYTNPDNFVAMNEDSKHYFSIYLDLTLTDGQCIGPNGSTRSLYYVDGVGNPYTQYLKFYCFDKAKPTVSFVDSAAPYTVIDDGARAVVHLTGVDATCTNVEDLGQPGSGVVRYGYADANDPNNITWLADGETEVTIDKSGTYNFYNVDAVGNVSEPIECTVALGWFINYNNTNGSEGSIPTQSVTINEKATLSDGSPLSLNHAVLVGWSTKPGLKELDPIIDYQLSQEVFNEVPFGSTLDLYAVWRPWWYYVTYHSNIEGQPDETTTRNDVRYEFDVPYTPMTDAESPWKREGYYIDRWSTTPRLSGKGYTTSNEYNNLGNPTFQNMAKDGQTAHLYAIWKGNPYKLIIHDNYKNCKCDVEEHLLTVGEEFVLPKTSNVHSGSAKLLGYSETPTFTSTPTYRPVTSVRDLATTAGAEVHLYRIWDEPPKVSAPSVLKIDKAQVKAAGIVIENGAVVQSDLEYLLMQHAKATDTEWTLRYGTDYIPAGQHKGYSFKVTIDAVDVRDNVDKDAANYIVTFIVTDDAGNSATAVTELFFGDPGEDSDDWITILTGTY